MRKNYEPQVGCIKTGLTMSNVKRESVREMAWERNSLAMRYKSVIKNEGSADVTPKQLLCRTLSAIDGGFKAALKPIYPAHGMPTIPPKTLTDISALKLYSLAALHFEMRVRIQMASNTRGSAWEPKNL